MNQNKNIEDIYPLSPMQQGILFHTLLSPNSGEYIPQVCLTLTGLLNIEQFKQALGNTLSPDIKAYEPLFIGNVENNLFKLFIDRLTYLGNNKIGEICHPMNSKTY